MPTTYITNADLIAKVAARTGQTPDHLIANGSQWNGIIEDANLDAYNHIRSVLVGRGFTTAIIDTWDRRAEFNRKVALCFAMREGAAFKLYDVEAINQVCKCLEELEDLPILVNGVEQDAASGASGVNYGDMERTDDIFTLDMEL